MREKAMTVNERVNSILRFSGYQIVSNRAADILRRDAQPDDPGLHRLRIPDGAADYLVERNPRLVELKERYARFDRRVTEPFVWTDDVVTSGEMGCFRGDNAYMWQTRDTSEAAYALAAYYVKSIDRLGLLDKLGEADDFGVWSFTIGSMLVSRDLLDSITELYFLDRQLNISSIKNLTILDIGAGYGRLAHRAAASLPNLAGYICTDAFALSTFISEYYLRCRNVDSIAKVIPLDEIEYELQGRSVYLAVNIHSFSECRPEAIDWWLSLIAKHGIKNLMVVPNGTQGLKTNNGVDFGGIIRKYGYELKVKEPKYRDPVVQRYGVHPANYYLFQLAPHGTA
jgi:hypothetical protein